jgi:serine/threonine-protein kinase
MQAGNFQAACDKLAASQNLDAGLGTLMLLSDCYEKTGRTASAWATFREAAAVARAQNDQDREDVARRRADALEPNLARLVIHGAESTMKLGGLRVIMNGQPVERAQWGTMIPVDPGEVSFEVTAPGYEPWTLTAQVVQGPSETAIDIPELQPAEEDSKAAPNSEASSAQVLGDSTSQGATSDAGSESSNTLKTSGLTLGVTGLVAVGVGSFFGLQAKSKNDDSKEHCNDNRCSQQGVDLRSDAQTAATTATIAFGLGGALLAIGGVLYFTSADDSNQAASPKELRWTSRVAPGQAYLGLEGVW